MATVRPEPRTPPPPQPPARAAAAADAARRPQPEARPAGNEDQQPASAGDAHTTQALLPVAPAVLPGPAEPSAEGWLAAIDGPVARLPVELDVVVPVREFRVRHLLALEPGEVIESQWNYGEDVPLAAGDVQLSWSEFEVLDNQLAVRITRLP